MYGEQDTFDDQEGPVEPAVAHGPGAHRRPVRAGRRALLRGSIALGAAAASAVLATLRDEHLVERSAVLGERLRADLGSGLAQTPTAGDIRGLGLMIGIELVRDRKTKERAVEERTAIVQAMFRRGVLILGAGRNAIRFAPPLVITKDQADAVLRAFDESLTEVTHGHPAGAGRAS